MSDSENEKKPSATLIKKAPEAPIPPVAKSEGGVDAAKKKRVVVVKRIKKEDENGAPVVAAAQAPSVKSEEPPSAPVASGGSPAQPTPAAAPAPIRQRVASKAGNLAGGPPRSPSRYPQDRPYGERAAGAPTTASRDDKPYGERSSRPPYGGDRPAGAGYQGSRPYGDRPAGTGYQGSRPMGDRPAGTGYQGSRPYGDRPAGTGYQGSRPYGDRPAGTGYQGSRPYGDRPAGTGYQGSRPYGPRPGGAPGSTPSIDLTAGKVPGKKAFKAKRTYKTKQEEYAEKAFRQKRKVDAMLDAVPESIDVMENITVSDLARKMNIKASELISKLMSMGTMVTINQQIDAETAELLAAEYNCKVRVVSLYDETVIEGEESAAEDIVTRPPVVTIMGHVDHGKTKTLDAIRSANVAAGEAGGITQHIGAYSVTVPDGRKITFLDTPGHEAFTMMRARGAKVTDVVVLVVSAVEGIMAQTIEAINHAKAAQAPIIVAVNKMDLVGASLDRVKQQLSDHGLVAEDWSGNTVFVPISALRKEGIDKLLEAILLQAEMMDLKAAKHTRAEGSVVEARIDQGRGVAATVLVRSGELKVGDPFVAGIYFGKIRALYNDRGERVQTAGPSDPVEITGFSEGAPQAGDPFQVTVDERSAAQVSAKRRELRKMEEAKNVKKVTLSNLYDTIKEGGLTELRVVIKGDVHGSVEALKSALEKLSNSEIRLVVLHAAAGAIVEQDVKLASAVGGIVVGFHVRPTAKAQLAADQEKVEIRKYNLIYEAVEDISMAMEGLLSPDLREETTGTIEVRKVFHASKIGDIAGCMVLTGFVTRKSKLHVLRDHVALGDCTIAGLKRFNDDVKEVKEGFECGITLEGFGDIREGDILEAYDVKEVKRKLSSVAKNNGEKKDDAPVKV